MDFRSLTRRELQALCKKNKIHANMTNVAMADALQDLDLVEGIEDFIKPSETAMSSTRTRSSTRRKLAGNVDDEVVQTPVVPTVGRREKQDVPKTPGVVLTSQKREAKEKSSVRQVYTIRRSARLAAKRLKESGKQDIERSGKQDIERSGKRDNERSDQSITFDNFSEAVPKGLEVNTGRGSLHFDDEVRKAGIDSKTAEGLDSKKAKEGATDLSPLSFEFENLNLSNKELKVDMPKSSKELATSDNTNAIIENNVEMLLSNKLGEGKQLNDDKAKKLDSSLDVEPANFVLDENSSDNGLSDGKESHCDERFNETDKEPNNEQISVGEVKEDADLQCKGQEVVGKDDNIKHSSDYEVQGADIHCDGQQIVGNDMVHLDNEDDPKTEEDDLRYKVEEVVGKDDNIEHSSDYEVEGEETTDDENEMSYEALCYSEDEDASEAITGDENSDAELPTEAGSESLDSELSFDEFIGDENKPNTRELEDEDTIDANSKSLDGEGSLEKLAGDDEKEPNNEGLSEDEDGIDSNCESLDGEGSLEKLTGDEKELNNEGLSEDEDGTDSNSESLDGEGSLEKLTGDEKEAKNEGLSYNMDAIEDKKSVQEYVQSSAGKEPFVFLESSVPQVGPPIGGPPLSALAFDPKEIPIGSAEPNLGHTIQMISSTPVKKKSSIKTPKKTPILSAGVKSVSDDKENVDNSGRKLVRIKKNKKKQREDCSPREITKSNASTKETTRSALQQLQENCLVDSSGNTVEV